jgi:hypothetical protein
MLCAQDGSVIELADMALWMHADAEGFDGRFYNQWAMLARCHDLMHRSLGGTTPDFVIRGRPDLRAACIPRPLESCGAGGPYLAMQDYLWGSDAFFYGVFLPDLPLTARRICGCDVRAQPRKFYWVRLAAPIMRHSLVPTGAQGMLRRWRACATLSADMRSTHVRWGMPPQSR